VSLGTNTIFWKLCGFTWGLDKVDGQLLKQVLNAKDFKARAAAVGVLRYAGHQIPDQADLLMQAAKDDNPRVRLEALVAGLLVG